MIDFINYLKSIIDSLEEKITEINNSPDSVKYKSLIEELKKYVNSEPSEIDLEFLDKVLEDFYKKDISEEEKETIEFIREVCIPNPNLFVLEGSQVDSFNDVVSHVDSEIQGLVDASKFESEKGKMLRLLNSIEGDGEFDEMELLEEYLDNYDVSEIDRLKIIRDVIEKNSKIERYKPTTSENEKSTPKMPFDIEDEEDDEIEENLNETEKIDKENKIRDLLKEYGYNYDFFSDKIKNDLISKGNLSRMREVLSTLQDIKFDYEKNQAHLKTFPMILIKSNKEKIETIISLIKNNLKILDYKSIILQNPSILYGRSKGEGNLTGTISSSSQYIGGAYTNFVKNITFFENEKVDLTREKRLPISIIMHSHATIKSNYYLLTKVYGFDIRNSIVLPNGNSKKFPLSCLVGNTILNLETWIELSPNGYEYVRQNPSRLGRGHEEIIPFKYYTIVSGDFLTSDEGVVRLIYHFNDYVRTVEVNNDILYDQRRAMKELTKGDLELFQVDYDKLMEYEMDQEEYKRALSVDFIKKIDESYRSNDPKERDLVYIFGDVKRGYKPTRISRYKVLRIISYLLSNNYSPTFKMVEYAITYGSYLSEQDVKNIGMAMKREFLRNQSGDNGHTGYHPNNYRPKRNYKRKWNNG